MLVALEQEQVLVDQDDGTINEVEIQADLIAKINKLNKSQTTDHANNVLANLGKIV